MKKEIAKINYEDMNFKFIENHWDIHLKGTCIYNNELCEFNCEYPGYDEKTEEFEPTICTVYLLSPLEKIKKLYTQKKFEQCIGYHWTYPYRKTGEKPFRYRKPQWLYKLIFNLYYYKQILQKKRYKKMEVEKNKAP